MSTREIRDVAPHIAALHDTVAAAELTLAKATAALSRSAATDNLENVCDPAPIRSRLAELDHELSQLPSDLSAGDQRVVDDLRLRIERMTAQLPSIVQRWSASKRARSRSALLSGAAAAAADLDSEITLSSTQRTMTSLVQRSQMVGEAFAQSSEGLSRISHKSRLISNHVDDANRIMRRMRSLLSLEHALAVAGFIVLMFTCGYIISKRT